jgi:DNA polymerase III alpha subunit (gram-positive type)
MKFIAFDCETGGTDPKIHSLLTVYFGIYNNNLILEDSLELSIKPNSGDYVCNGEAMGINKINLIEHDKIAIGYSKAGYLLREFLTKHSLGGKDKLIPVGHNVRFDIDFVTEKLLKTFNHYVSYRTLDTGSIGQFLKLSGLIPDDNLGGLNTLAKHMRIEIPEESLHNARVDTNVTVNLLRKFKELVGSKYE